MNAERDRLEVEYAALISTAKEWNLTAVELATWLGRGAAVTAEFVVTMAPAQMSTVVPLPETPRKLRWRTRARRNWRPWRRGLARATPAKRIAAAPVGANLPALLNPRQPHSGARRGRRPTFSAEMLRRAMELREPTDGSRPASWPKIAETIRSEFAGELRGRTVAHSTLRQAYERWRNRGSRVHAIAAE